MRAACGVAVSFQRRVLYRIAKPQAAVLADLSANGCRLTQAEGLAFGSVLEVRIPLSSGRELHAAGRVVWVRRHPFEQDIECGVVFGGLADKQRDLLVAEVFQRERQVRRSVKLQ